MSAPEAILNSPESRQSLHGKPIRRPCLLEIKLGCGLVSLCKRKSYPSLATDLDLMKKQLLMKYGIPLPPIRIRECSQIAPEEYHFTIHGKRVAGARLKVGHLLALHAGMVHEPILGESTWEPAFGTRAWWIHESKQEAAERYGYIVANHQAIIVTHLTEVVKANSAAIIGLHSSRTIIDFLFTKQMQRIRHEFIHLGFLTHTKSIIDSAFDRVDPHLIRMILQSLVDESVPIHDIVTILHVIIRSRSKGDVGLLQLIEMIRQALRKDIVNLHLEPDGNLDVITVDRRLELEIAKNATCLDHEGSHQCDQARMQHIREVFISHISRAHNLISSPIVLTTPMARIAVKKMMASAFPRLIVLSHNEIEPGIPVRTIDTVMWKHVAESAWAGASTGGSSSQTTGLQKDPVVVSLHSPPDSQRELLQGYDSDRS